MTEAMREALKAAWVPWAHSWMLEGHPDTALAILAHGEACVERAA